ncbi:MAG: hypothetical protein HY520_01980, partial [Candidatus Aenigmarchaeota archaeon]|nr:hypothetical protein [Candidatus Aenigmarchaeota archaeon]
GPFPVGTNYTLANASGVWGVTLSQTAANYRAQFFVTDTLGATNHTVSSTYTVNLGIPNVTLLSPANASHDNTTVNFNVTVHEFEMGSVTLEITQADGAITNYTLANRSGTWGATNASIAEGTYAARFYATDAAGQTNASVNVTFGVRRLPKVILLLPANETLAAGNVSFNVTVLEENPASGIVQITPLSPAQTPGNYTLANRSGVWGYTNLSMPDGTYSAQFFLNDTLGNANVSVNVTFTISTNAAPAITTPVVSPSSPSTADTLGCTATPTDPEQASLNVSFTWFLNGAPHTAFDANASTTNGTAVSSPTIVSGLAKGQIWICSARAFDGFLYSDPKNSSPVVVGNTPPAVATPRIFNASLAETAAFSPGEKVVIKVNVTDANGRDDLHAVQINISDPLHALRVEREAMTRGDVIADGYTYLFNYTIPVNLSGVWIVSIAANDSNGSKGNNTGAFIVGFPVPSFHAIKIVLRLNSTTPFVFIPGVGELQAAALPNATYAAPPDFFLASYLGETLRALVFAEEEPISIGVGRNATHHFLTLNQSLANSQAFLVSSQGDYRTIQNRVPAIEGGTFHEQPSFIPSPLVPGIILVLKPPAVDIQGTVVVRGTPAQLIVEHLGDQNGVPVIRIERL